jgi:hypothetical protein
MAPDSCARGSAASHVTLFHMKHQAGLVSVALAAASLVAAQPAPSELSAQARKAAAPSQAPSGISSRLIRRCGEEKIRGIKMATGRTGEELPTALRAQNVLVIATVVCGLASAAPGSAEDRVIDAQRSTLTVRVFKSGLFRAFADDHIIQAPLMDGSLDDSAAPHVQIVIDARRMRVLDPGLSAKDRQEVQARMLGSEVLDVNRFQWISFHSVAIQRLDAGGWLVRGELDLHGQIHAILVNVLPEKSHYKGSVTLRQSDFGIVPISIAGGTVKVKDEIEIAFDIALTGR